MMHNYFRIGGVKDDLPSDFSTRMHRLMEQLNRGIAECDELLSQNEMFLARTKGIGAVSAPGPPLTSESRGLRCGQAAWRRMCGVSEPYSIYDRFDFGIPVGTLRRLLGQVLCARGGDAAVDANHRAGDGADGAGTE